MRNTGIKKGSDSVQNCIRIDQNTDNSKGAFRYKQLKVILAQSTIILAFSDEFFLSSSSSGATTSNFECFGLLNIQFPLITTLDAANPILYCQFLHVISYVIFPSVLWSPLWSYWHWFPLISYSTILSSGIRCKWPNQLNRCAFVWFIIFSCLINSSTVYSRI